VTSPLPPPSPEYASEQEQPSAADARHQLERILVSPAFTANGRRKALLRYLVDETLAGRPERLKGFTIAVAVFGRDETFDAQSDPLVRLEARRLRRDLDIYYGTVGGSDPVRITIPKGAYVPCFAWQGGGRDSVEPRDKLVAPDAAAVDSAMPDAAVNANTRNLPGATIEVTGTAHSAVTGRSIRLLLGTALILVVAAAGWLWNQRMRESSELAPQERGPTVIVLPFESLSTREDDRFLAAGMTQQLITDLMRFDAFKLYSVPSSFRQNASADPVDLGRSLAVAYVVKGSVRSGGEKVRISTQLFDGKTGQVLWSETYDGELTPGNMLSVQDDLSDQIATRLGQPYGVVRSVAAELFRKDRPQTMIAYECVLRAYAYRRTYSRELYPGTRGCLEAVVRQDPDYAEGWAFLGWLRMDAVRLGLVQGDEAKAEMDQALSATSHALELAPKNAVALQAAAAVAWYRGDLEAAERLQRQALALNPHDPEILAQFGWRLAVRERWDEGLGYLGQAIERTINPPGWYHILFAIHHYLHGNYTAALAAAERAKTDAFGIGWSLVAINQAALGNPAEASRALAEMAARSPLLARDPAAAYRIHQPTEAIVGALVDGLRKAGWKEPNASTATGGQG
jgi:TolB-like protein